MLMMIRSTKISAPPPVPPRPSKTIVAEALAKSRKVSPVRALYATQPLSVGDLQPLKNMGASYENASQENASQENASQGNASQKNATPIVPTVPTVPVVPVRTAPPPPLIKPKPQGQIAQPQVVKSYSSAMVFNPKLRHPEEPKVIRSVSDVSDEITCGKSRTIVYQSSNLKTSNTSNTSKTTKSTKIEVNLGRRPSVKEQVNTANERNKLDFGSIEQNKGTPRSIEQTLGEKGTPGYLEQTLGEKGTPRYLEQTLGEKGTPRSIEQNLQEQWTSRSIEQTLGEKGTPRSMEQSLQENRAPRSIEQTLGIKGTPRSIEETLGENGTPRNIEQTLQEKWTLRSIEQTLQEKGTSRHLEQTLGEKGKSRHLEQTLGEKGTPRTIEQTLQEKWTSRTIEQTLGEKWTPKTIEQTLGEKWTPKTIEQIQQEKGTPEIETPEKGTAEKNTPEKGTAEKNTPEKGTAEKDTPEKYTPEKQTPLMNSKKMNPIDKVIDVIIKDKKTSETIVQSSDKTTIIVTTKKPDDDNNNSNPKNSNSSFEDPNKKVQFDDKLNHEILIAELQCMKEEQERFLKRQRKAPVEIYDCDNESVLSNSDATRIQHSDWIEVANNGEEVRLSSCQIYIDNNSDESSKSSSFSSSSSRRNPQRAPSMSSLHGLPPLPKSLSGFNLLDSTSAHRVETPRGTYRVPASPGPQTPSRAGSSRGATPPTPGSGTGHVVYPPHPRVNGTEVPRGRKITTLDTQLAVLRREMYGLRQLDLSLLSQLYSLNEAIQDFRQMLQDQEDSALSPNSPSPSPSSGDEGDEFYSPAPLRYKPAPPAPPLRRTSNSSSANSSEYGTV